MTTLLVIVPDKLSALISKGEITDRYYNPGNLFTEVHLLMTNNDQPDAALLQRTVGTAKLYLHNLPFTRWDFLRSLALRPWALGSWARPAVELARRVKPSLIRCHGDSVNIFLAHKIKQELSVPYVVSIHTTRDDKLPGSQWDLTRLLSYWMFWSMRKVALRNADLVLPVYQSATRFLDKLGKITYKVAYNVVCPDGLREKTSFALSDPVRILYVGRLNQNKYPINLIYAVRQIADSHLTVIGDGPERQNLIKTAMAGSTEKKFSFIPSLANEQLCAKLADFDIFAIQTDHQEVPKSLIEAMLVGLPCIIDYKDTRALPELAANVLMVENTVDGYLNGLSRLIKDNNKREVLGTNAREFAAARWAPEKTEENFVDMYRGLLEGGVEVAERRFAR